MLRHIGPLTGPAAGTPARKPGGAGKPPETSFQDVLAREAGKQPPGDVKETNGPSSDVRLSAHARERLDSRQIAWTDQYAARLEDAVDRAGEKGASKSLVLLDDLALVVSVRNRVVITALDEPNARSGVFTNIDSAVIA